MIKIALPLLIALFSITSHAVNSCIDLFTKQQARPQVTSYAKEIAQARQEFRSGQFEASARILAPIVKAQPENSTALELTGNIIIATAPRSRNPAANLEKGIRFLDRAYKHAPAGNTIFKDAVRPFFKANAGPMQ